MNQAQRTKPDYLQQQAEQSVRLLVGGPSQYLHVKARTKDQQKNVYLHRFGTQYLVADSELGAFIYGIKELASLVKTHFDPQVYDADYSPQNLSRSTDKVFYAINDLKTVLFDDILNYIATTPLSGLCCSINWRTLEQHGPHSLIFQMIEMENVLYVVICYTNDSQKRSTVFPFVCSKDALTKMQSFFLTEIQSIPTAVRVSASLAAEIQKAGIMPKKPRLMIEQKVIEQYPNNEPLLILVRAVLKEAEQFSNDKEREAFLERVLCSGLGLPNSAIWDCC